MTRAIAVVPARLPIGEAARLGRRRRARLLLAPLGTGWGGVTPPTLDHALRLGLASVPVRTVLWKAPSIGVGAPEVRARRRMGPATPFLVVLDRGRALGAILGDPAAGGALPLSMADRLGGLPEPLTRVLRRAGAVGDERGWPVAAVGGLARDLILERVVPAHLDLDLAVDGDARALGRQLAADLGGGVREHPAFLTATVELPNATRADVVTARRERYRAPGALPDVEPASLDSDLRRRDFAVNALAIRVNGPAWGQVLDPTGGLADLRGRRIRVLHPLSFVEDPTRIFRAVRFAVRLGFRLDAATGHLLAEAVRLSVYGALSGDRLRRELALILEEVDPAPVLGQLGRRGAYRLLLPGYRFPAGARALLGQVANRAAELPLAPETREALYVLALTAHLTPEAAESWIQRIAVPPAALADVARARADVPGILARLSRAGGPAAAYAVLRRVPEAVAAWAHVRARRAGPRRVIAQHLRGWRGMRPLLTGDDLKELGLEPGPELGSLLEALVGAQAGGDVRSREDALVWAREAIRVAANPAACVTERGG